MTDQRAADVTTERGASGARGERTHLSVGDALTIVALLGFAVGWMVLMTMTGSNDMERSDPPFSNADRTAAVIYLGLVLIPPVWAGALVRKIVERSL